MSKHLENGFSPFYKQPLQIRLKQHRTLTQCIMSNACTCHNCLGSPSPTFFLLSIHPLPL